MTDINVGVMAGAGQQFELANAPAMPHLDGSLHAAQPGQQPLQVRLPSAQQPGNLHTADDLGDTHNPQTGQYQQHPNVGGTARPIANIYPAANIERRSCQLAARHLNTGSKAVKLAAGGGPCRGHKRRAAAAAASGFKAPANTWLPGDEFPKKKRTSQPRPKIFAPMQQQQQQMLQNLSQQTQREQASGDSIMHSSLRDAPQAAFAMQRDMQLHEQASQQAQDSLMSRQHGQASIGSTSTAQHMSQGNSGKQPPLRADSAVQNHQLLPEATSQQSYAGGAVQEVQSLTQPRENIQHMGASSVQNMQPMHQAEQGSPHSQAGETTPTHGQAGQTAAVRGVQQDSQSTRGSKRKRRAAARSDDSGDEDWTPKRMCRQRNTPSCHTAAAFPRQVGLALKLTAQSFKRIYCHPSLFVDCLASTHTADL